MAQNIKFSSLSCLFYLMILTVLKYYREGMCYRKVFSYNKKIILRFSCEKGYRILWSYGVNEKPHRSDSLHSYGCYTDVCLNVKSYESSSDSVRYVSMAVIKMLCMSLLYWEIPYIFAMVESLYWFGVSVYAWGD